MSRAVFIVVVLMVAACGGRTDGSAAPTGASAPVAAPAAASSVEAAYEALRVALVNDDFQATKAAAPDLAKAAAADEVLAAAAHAIGTAADIEAARLAFGDASRQYLTLLSKDPARAAGKFAFRCPMAKGYKLWVQLSDGINNPYMGQRMLECGGPVDLAP